MKNLLAPFHTHTRLCRFNDLVFVILSLAFLSFISCQKETPKPDPVLPAIATNEVSAITMTSAISGGNITSDGGAAITVRGICWGLSANPTVADNKTSDGAGLGSYTSSITGLTAGTSYHARAYAKNSAGVVYGIDVSFTTNAIMHDVTVFSGTNGTVTASKQVANGGKLDIMAVPNLGFMTDSITVNGVKFNLNGVNSYAIMNNQKPPVVNLTFKMDVMWTLLEKPWIEVLLQERLVGGTTWGDNYGNFRVEKYAFHNNNQVSFYLDGNQGPDRRYEVKGDSLIIGADINGRYGNRYKMISISRETLILREIIEYVTPEGKLDPSKNKESQKTFKH